MKIGVPIAMLLVATASNLLTARSLADDRSIYNRTGAKVRLSLRQTAQDATPIQSPLLEHNQKWSVDLAPQTHEVRIEHPNGVIENAGTLSFEDPRKNVANLVKQQTAKTVLERDPDTGQVKSRVEFTNFYSFVYGVEGVDQKGLRMGITVIEAPRGVQITVVHPNMPSGRCQAPDGQVLTLTTGDTIISINGREVSGLDGMTRAVAESPRNMRFQVTDGRTGELFDLSTELAW